MKTPWFVWPFLVFWVITVVFYVSAQIRVHKSCDGQVVKNTFDWPVCVH